MFIDACRNTFLVDQYSHRPNSNYINSERDPLIYPMCMGLVDTNNTFVGSLMPILRVLVATLAVPQGVINSSISN